MFVSSKIQGDANKVVKYKLKDNHLIELFHPANPLNVKYMASYMDAPDSDIVRGDNLVL